MLKNYIEGQIVYDKVMCRNEVVIVSIMDTRVLVDYVNEDDRYSKDKYMVFPKDVFKQRFIDDLTQYKIEALSSEIESLERNIKRLNTDIESKKTELNTLKKVA